MRSVLQYNRFSALTAIWARDISFLFIFMYTVILGIRRDVQSTERMKADMCVQCTKKNDLFLQKEAENNQVNVIETNCIDIAMTYLWCIGWGLHFYFAPGATVCIGVCHFQRLNIRFTNKKYCHSCIKEMGLLSRNQSIIGCHLLSAKSILQQKQEFPLHCTLVQF